VTSPRKITANRANARLSSGPKTAVGKTRSAQNAFRHGLNVPVVDNPALASNVETLARRICGGNDLNPIVLEAARRIAEAQIDLRRVRAYRHRLIEQALGDPEFQTTAAQRAQLKVLTEFLRKSGNVPMPDESLPVAIPQPPQGPGKLAVILAEFARELARLDRYERRALSRRKFAIREFDALAASV
jgi:hypothetical protein